MNKVFRVAGFLRNHWQVSPEYQLVVNDYDEAIEFYTNKLNFDLIEDKYIRKENKRWVTIAPKCSTGTSILLAKAKTGVQKEFIGNQTGGRVFLFLKPLRRRVKMFIARRYGRYSELY